MNVCQKNLNTLRNTVERLYLQSIIMGTANISNNKNKTKTFFMFLSCFFLSQRFFSFLNMLLFFKKYNKEIITFLIWEHYLTTYSLGQLIQKCLFKQNSILKYSSFEKSNCHNHLNKTKTYLTPPTLSFVFF